MAFVVGTAPDVADILALVAGTTSRPLVILRKTLPSSVANNGINLDWDIEDVDTHGWHDTGVNPSRITPTVAGWIRFTGTVQFAPNATGRRSAAIRVNGSTLHYGARVQGTSAGNMGVTVTKTLQANGTTDYFECFAFQESGGALNAVDGASTCFEAEWLRDP